jgi:hypothetical protein
MRGDMSRHYRAKPGGREAAKARGASTLATADRFIRLCPGRVVEPHLAIVQPAFIAAKPRSLTEQDRWKLYGRGRLSRAPSLNVR